MTVVLRNLGSLHEVLYSLMSYGIPKAILPIDDFGTVEVESFLRWLDSVEQRSGQQLSPDRMSYESSSWAVLNTPGENDVLLGRGRIIEGSRGNLRLKRVVEMNIAHYQSASRFERTSVAHAVYLRFKQDGAKFLRKENERWVEVDEQTARDKIAHTFRNHRRNKSNLPAIQPQQQQPLPPVLAPREAVFKATGSGHFFF